MLHVLERARNTCNMQHNKRFTSIIFPVSQYVHVSPIFSYLGMEWTWANGVGPIWFQYYGLLWASD